MMPACTDETLDTEQYNYTYATYNIRDSDMIEVCSHYSKQASQYSDILVAMASLWLLLSVSTLHIAETTEQLSAKNVIYNTNSHMSCHHSVLKRHAHIAALQLRRQDREHRAAWASPPWVTIYGTCHKLLEFFCRNPRFAITEFRESSQKANLTLTLTLTLTIYIIHTYMEFCQSAT